MNKLYIITGVLWSFYTIIWFSYSTLSNEYKISCICFTYYIMLNIKILFAVESIKWVILILLDSWAKR